MHFFNNKMGAPARTAWVTPPLLRELNPPWTNPLNFHIAALKFFFKFFFKTKQGIGLSKEWRTERKLHKKGKTKSEGVVNFSWNKATWSKYKEKILTGLNFNLDKFEKTSICYSPTDMTFPSWMTIRSPHPYEKHP